MSFEMRELGEQLVEQAIAMIGPLFPELFSGLAGKVREAHNSILAASPETNGWVTALATFEWTIEAGADLILPDAVALACEEDGPFMPLLFTKAANLCTVLMPVSPNRMLVGRLASSEQIDLNCWPEDGQVRCVVTDRFFLPPHLR